VQPLFANGQIYAPARDWSELVIDEMKAVTGQLGAASVKQLRDLTIRHAGAIGFRPSAPCSKVHGNVDGNI
jgi:hypothetical protein